jgi:DNA-binding NarL/FixJ family response regulator
MNKVVIIDADSIFSQNLNKRINSIPHYECIQLYSTFNNFMSSSQIVDFIFLEHCKEDSIELKRVSFILNIMPSVKILIFSSIDDTSMITKYFELGVIGFIDKKNFIENSLEEILNTVEKWNAYMSPVIVRKVIESFKKIKIPNISEREQDVVQGILDGLTYLQIANKYCITIDTVRSHIKNIYKKLNINSKAQLFKLYNRQYI